MEVLAIVLYVAVIPFAYAIIFAGWQRRFKSLAEDHAKFDSAISVGFAFVWPMGILLSLMFNGWKGMLWVSEADTYTDADKFPSLYGPNGLFPREDKE